MDQIELSSRDNIDQCSGTELGPCVMDEADESEWLFVGVRDHHERRKLSRVINKNTVPDHEDMDLNCTRCCFDCFSTKPRHGKLRRLLGETKCQAECASKCKCHKQNHKHAKKKTKKKHQTLTKK